MLKAVSDRRSIRKFKKTDVPPTYYRRNHSGRDFSPVVKKQAAVL